MKLHDNAQPVERIGAVTEHKSFGIKSTGKAFQVLSSKLYKNKIAAIIREISCNAYDSHVAAGNPEEPFEVHLPSGFEPHFSVRDFGTGLDHEQVLTIFTTFFESTKEDSNDFIGALGLGSKSPFSYVDSFTVYAYHGGQMSSYECYLENGIPQVSRKACVASNERAGVEIVMSVQPNDVYKFITEAQAIYRWFRVRPTFVGSPAPRIEDYEELRGSCWSVDRYRRTNLAIMGQVCYPLDLSIAEVRDLAGFCIHFDLGELDVQAGREELSYDKQTIAAIQKRAELVRGEVQAIYEHVFDGCENIFDAAWKLKDSKDILLEMIQPKFKGQVVRPGSISGAFSNMARCHTFGEMKDKTTKDITVFIADSNERYGDQRYNLWRKENPDLCGVEVSPYRGHLGTQDVIDLIGTIPYVLASSIALPPRKAKVRKLGTVNTDIRRLDDVEIDLNKGGFYLVARNLYALDPRDDAKNVPYSIFQQIHSLMVKELYPDIPQKEIVVVPWSRRAEMTGDGWKSAYEALTAIYKARAKDKDFRKQIKLARTYTRFETGVTDIGFDRLDGLREYLPKGHPVRDFIEFRRECRTAHSYGDHWRTYEVIFEGADAEAVGPTDLLTMWKDIDAEYPLLREMYRRYNGSTAPLNIVHHEMAVYATSKLSLLKAA